MIVTRTPLRMSFVGGGSDLPSYYRRHGGAVLSTAIDRYIYVNVNRKFDNGIRVAYSKTEEVESIEQVEHKLVRATLEMMDMSGGIEITTIADIPSRGTGLGSSSAFTVGLINALGVYANRRFDAAELGRASCEVELDRCGEPIGKQDQYASAFGGMNIIEFKSNDSVDVTPVRMPVQTQFELQQRLLFFYTGSTRSASALLKSQDEAVQTDTMKQAALNRMVDLAFILRDQLQSGSLDSMGEILHENWELKKSLSHHVSNGAIDQMYDAARGAGALGGKLLGAGAGGFLMFYADQDAHPSIALALAQLRRVQFGFEATGSTVVLDDRRRTPTDLVENNNISRAFAERALG